jgi:hypothetical protein
VSGDERLVPRGIHEERQFVGYPDPVYSGQQALDIDAAYTFFDRCGIKATPDAIGQLVEVFLPCLRIMAERGYDPEGKSWRDKGWRDQVVEILERADRIHFNSWAHSRFDENNARDLINYCGFYLRLRGKGERWGKWGEPGD